MNRTQTELKQLVREKERDNEWRISEIRRMAQEKDINLDGIDNHIQNVLSERNLIAFIKLECLTKEKEDITK